MTVTYVQKGDSIDYTPSSVVSAGGVVVQGGLVGVAKLDIAANTLGALAVSGVFDISKATGAGTAIAVGTFVYYDEIDQVVTEDDGGGDNKLIGITVAAASDDDETARVLLVQGERDIAQAEATETGTETDTAEATPSATGTETALDQYTVSGAGTAAVNGTYARSGDFGGKPRYTYDTWDILYTTMGGSYWVITYADDGDYMHALYYTDETGDTPPTTGWTTLGGSAPAPTVTQG